nr:secreted seminal-vesicle Ly-6 protein 1-like [Loxodonta africana]
MDKRLLLPMLGLSLLLGFLQALQCYKCPRIIHDGTCKISRTTCVAGVHEDCFLFKQYKGNKFLYGSQDCRDFGRNLTLLQCPLYTTVKTCRKNFCNKFRRLQLKRDRCLPNSTLPPSRE